MAIGEMPTHNHSGSAVSGGAHTHSIQIWKNSGESANNHISGSYSKDSQGNTGSTNSGGAHTHSLTINNTGSGNAHNNIQPYIAVFLWKRTN